MISIRNISKWYGEFRALNKCSTEVSKGEVVVVCGPSGSGKSTLIKCVNGLESFQEGEIWVDNISVADRKTDLPKLRARVGMVFQHFELFPHLTILDNITLAQCRVLGRSKKQAVDKAVQLLEMVGLVEHQANFPLSFPAGSNNGWRLPERSPWIRSRCFLMNRPLLLIRK